MKITVCDKCLTAACWEGIFYCHHSLTAGTRKIEDGALEMLGKEHHSWWNTQKQNNLNNPGKPESNGG